MMGNGNYQGNYQQGYAVNQESISPQSMEYRQMTNQYQQQGNQQNYQNYQGGYGYK